MVESHGSAGQIPIIHAQHVMFIDRNAVSYEFSPNIGYSKEDGDDPARKYGRAVWSVHDTLEDAKRNSTYEEWR